MSCEPISEQEQGRTSTLRAQDNSATKEGSTFGKRAVAMESLKYAAFADYPVCCDQLQGARCHIRILKHSVTCARTKAVSQRILILPAVPSLRQPATALLPKKKRLPRRCGIWWESGRKQQGLVSSPENEGSLVQGPKQGRKVGRPILYTGDPHAPGLTSLERRTMVRRLANRESARRVRLRRQDHLQQLEDEVRLFAWFIANRVTHMLLAQCSLFVCVTSCWGCYLGHPV